LNTFIRVEQSASIGLGHISRSIALARSLCKYSRVHIISSSFTSSPFYNCLDVSPYCNFAIPPSNSYFLHGLHKLLPDELSLCTSYITSFSGPKLIIVDSYFPRYEWLSFYFSYPYAIVCVLDDNSPAYMPVNIFTDTSFSRSPSALRTQVPDNAHIYSNSLFALIREPHAFYDSNLYLAKLRVPTIIIYLSDAPLWLYQNCVQAVISILSCQAQITIISHDSKLSSNLCITGNITVKKPLTLIESLFSDTTFFIGHCGVSALERLAWRIPSLSIMVSPDQLHNYQFLSQLGDVAVAHFSQCTIPFLIGLLGPLLTDPACPFLPTNQSQQLIDLKGPDRLALKLCDHLSNAREHNQ